MGKTMGKGYEAIEPRGHHWGPWSFSDKMGMLEH